MTTLWPRFGQVLRLRRDQGRKATIMVIGDGEGSGYVRAVILDADPESARTSWWKPGTTTMFDFQDIRDRFEIVP